MAIAQAVRKGRPKSAKALAEEEAIAAHVEQLAHHEAEVARWLARVEELGRQIGDDIANWRIASPPSADPKTWNTPVLRYWMFEAAMRWNHEQAETLRERGKPVFCYQCAVEENEGRPGPAWAAWKCFDHAWRDYLAGEAWERAKAHGGRAV